MSNRLCALAVAKSIVFGKCCTHIANREFTCQIRRNKLLLGPIYQLIVLWHPTDLVSKCIPNNRLCNFPHFDVLVKKVMFLFWLDLLLLADAVAQQSAEKTEDGHDNKNRANEFSCLHCFNFESL